MFFILELLFNFILAPWFLSLVTLSFATWFLYTKFDPIHSRNAQPQNTSHYQLPYNNKPSRALADEEMMMYYVSATELGRFLREKRISSTLLLKRYIDRLVHVNASINAAINYRFSQAMDEAIIVDDVIHQFSTLHQQLQLLPIGSKATLDLSSYNFEDYPFLSSLEIRNDQIHLLSKTETLSGFLSRYLPPFFGVPCTTKECFALKGMPHTSGLVSRRHQLAEYTSPVILNMQRAGLIVMATSNTSELCMWMESENKVYGQSLNPYGLKRTPGGSSGGEGALLGALATPISLGSDVGGSIRIPAFFNGIYSHKPTSSYVSCLGQIPSSRGGIPDFFCQAGPMARYPADLWPMLQVMVQTHHAPAVGLVGGGDDKSSTSILGPANQNMSDPKLSSSVLNLKSELGVLGEKRRVNLMPRPSIHLADVISLRSEYSTTQEGKTIIDPSSKHFHNKHGIAGKYEQNQHNPLKTPAPNPNPDINTTPHLPTPTTQLSNTQPLTLPNHSDDLVFTPYPHQNAKYYEFNALKSFTNEDYPILTSTHPSQVYYNTKGTQDLPRINQITPYQVDFKRVPVYNLKNFGTTFPPSSSVDPVLQQRQHEVSQFCANMGLDVYEIDVDELIAFYKQVNALGKGGIAATTAVSLSSRDEVSIENSGIYKLQKNPNFFIPIPGQPALTDLHTTKPVPKPVPIDPRTMPELQVFTEFVNAFDYWSAGMTFTFSAFRELLLQDCTVEAFQAIEKGKKKKQLQAQNEQIQMALNNTHPNPVADRKNMLQAQNEQVQMALSNTTTPSSQPLPTNLNTNDPNHPKTQQKQAKLPKINDISDSAHDPYGDYTSHEELSKHTTLSPETVAQLNQFQTIIYTILLVLSQIFHAIRHLIIKIALPLEGIPHFGEVEGAVEVRRQKELREYQRNQRVQICDSNNNSHNNNNNPKTLATTTTLPQTPSIRDIYPPMPLSHVQSPSMPIGKRIWFEIRVAVYIIYHLCLSCCSRQLIPTGTRCLAETQGQKCWHNISQAPWVEDVCVDDDCTDIRSHVAGQGLQSRFNDHCCDDLVKNLGTINSTHLNMTPRVLTNLISIKSTNTTSHLTGLDTLPLPHSNSTNATTHPTKNSKTIRTVCIKRRSRYDPNADESDHNGNGPNSDHDDNDSDDSDDDDDDDDDDNRFSQSDLDFDPTAIHPKPQPVEFKTTVYSLYLQHKAQFTYCNCTHVLQTAKQVKSMNRLHNHATISTIFQSFLPATPHTFPALLLALIDRFGDLTPQATLKTFTKCLQFSKNLNQLLAPKHQQPFGAVILAPPHPMQAPAHFVPCTRPFNFVYTGIFNATMQPATSVPTGLYRNLPTGLQVVGARHCDPTTIAMALLIHEQYGGWQPMKRLHSKYHITGHGQ